MGVKISEKAEMGRYSQRKKIRYLMKQNNAMRTKRKAAAGEVL